MYRLFNYPVSSSMGTVNSPLIPRVQSLIFQHYQYQLTNYEKFGSFVDSNFILSRLATRLDSYLDKEVDTFRIINENIHNICGATGISTFDIPGKMHSSSFYTDTCFIIACEFDIPSNIPDWRNYRPVRVLTHPSLSLEVASPHVGKNHLIDGLTVVGIDVALFGWMLKQWTIEKSTVEDIYQENISEFISKYILPMMVPEQFDIALRNRLSYIYEDKKPIVIEKERTFVRNYEDALEPSIKRVLDFINTSRSPYKKGLLEIPMVFKNNYLEAVPKEINVLSSYSYYITCLVMLDWLFPMVTIFGDSQKYNTDISKVIKRVDRYIKGTDCFKYMPDVIATEFDRKYAIFKEKFN